MRLVHGDELFRKVLDLHAHVFWACHWCHEVEIFEVNGAVACTLGQDDAVEVKLYRDHVNSGRSAVSGDVESVAANGESRASWVGLFGTIVCTDASICDVLEAVQRNFIACDENDGVGAFADAGNAWARRPSSVVYDFPQTSLYFGLTRRCRISRSSPMSMLRTALSISMGKVRRAALDGVRLRR